jgi:DNA (cytosine-5)-methyltransferase 1
VDFRQGKTGGYSLNYTPGAVTWVEARNAQATILVTHPIQDGRDMDKKQNGMGVGDSGDPSYTLDSTGAQAVAVLGEVTHEGHDASEDGTGRGTPIVSFYTTGGAQAGFAREGEQSVTLKVGTGLGIPSPPGIATETVVRRLIPLECERLQGLPDDHTRWRTEPDGTVVEQSDSARYRQIGNGLAVPVLQWVLQGIINDASSVDDMSVGSGFVAGSACGLAGAEPATQM